jgi:hypothetical protein
VQTYRRRRSRLARRAIGWLHPPKFHTSCCCRRPQAARDDHPHAMVGGSTPTTTQPPPHHTRRQVSGQSQQRLLTCGRLLGQPQNPGCSCWVLLDKPYGGVLLQSYGQSVAILGLTPGVPPRWQGFTVPPTYAVVIWNQQGRNPSRHAARKTCCPMCTEDQRCRSHHRVQTITNNE